MRLRPLRYPGSKPARITRQALDNWKAHPRPTLEVSIPAVPLSDYDELLQVQEAAG